MAISAPRSTEDASLSLTMAVVAASKSPVLLLDGELKVVAVSNRFAADFDVRPEAVRGRSLFGLAIPGWADTALKPSLQATADTGAEIEGAELDLREAGGGVRHLVVDAERLAYSDLDHVRVLVAVTDVTHARAEAELAEELGRQNALLLKEVRHRVANSLQIIAGLLLQEARNAPSEDTRSRLKRAHNRVMSVATLERQLAGGGEDSVRVRPYLVVLCDSIAASLLQGSDQISLDVQADDVRVGANQSVSLGLIVTELTINAVKYAFPDGRPGKIEVIYVSHEGGWSLTVRDDGVGMGDASNPASSGLGASIVKALAGHLGAGVSIDTAGPGHAVAILYPPDAQALEPPRSAAGRSSTETA